MAAGGAAAVSLAALATSDVLVLLVLVTASHGVVVHFYIL